MAGAQYSKAKRCSMVSGGLTLLVLAVIWQLTAYPSQRKVDLLHRKSNQFSSVTVQYDKTKELDAKRAIKHGLKLAVALTSNPSPEELQARSSSSQGTSCANSS